MKLREMKQAAQLLKEEWDLGEVSSKAKGNVCAWIYLFEILEKTEKIVIEKDNGNLIGFCGYAKWKSNKHIISKKFYHIIKVILIHSPLIKDKKAFMKYNDEYDYTPLELKDKFDGEISIIILNKNYRNKGLGKKMIQKIFEYAKEDNIKYLQILTDESCNFRFYESIGCKKVYEKTISMGKSNITEQGYIYEKKLTK